MPLGDFVGQGLESGNIFEQLQHRVGEICTGKLVSRFLANDLNEPAFLIVGKSVQLLSPADIHAETVQHLPQSRQRRIV